MLLSGDSQSLMFTPPALGPDAHSVVTRLERPTIGIGQCDGSRDAPRLDEGPERGHGVNPGQPNPTTLLCCFAGNPLQSDELFGCPLVVPADHRSFGLQRDDPIDSEFGELLHGPLWPIALHRCECNGELGRGPRLEQDLSVRFEDGTEPSGAPTPSSVADGDLGTVGDSKSFGQVVAVGVGQLEQIQVRNEDQGLGAT